MRRSVPCALAALLGVVTLAACDSPERVRPNPDDTLPPTSDVDMMIVLDGPLPPVKLGKVRYRGVLLDVTYLAAAELDSPGAVLSSYHLAPSFARPSIVLDPTGRLAALTADVAPANGTAPVAIS